MFYRKSKKCPQFRNLKLLTIKVMKLLREWKRISSSYKLLWRKFKKKRRMRKRRAHRKLFWIHCHSRKLKDFLLLERLQKQNKLKRRTKSQLQIPVRSHQRMFKLQLMLNWRKNNKNLWQKLLNLLRKFNPPLEQVIKFYWTPFMILLWKGNRNHLRKKQSKIKLRTLRSRLYKFKSRAAKYTHLSGVKILKIKHLWFLRTIQI